MLPFFPGLAGIWALQSLSLALTSLALPRLRLTSIFGPLLFVIALGLVNSTVWDAALFFRIPNTLTHQALVLVVANATIFWILVKLLPGIEIDGFLIALVAPIVFSFASMFVMSFGQSIDWPKAFNDLLHVIAQIKHYVEPPVSSSAS